MNAKAVPADFRTTLTDYLEDKRRFRSLLKSTYLHSFPELSAQTNGVLDSPLNDVVRVLEIHRDLAGGKREIIGVDIPVIMLTI